MSLKHAVLTDLCRELKMPAVLAEFESVARQVESEPDPFVAFLTEVLSREVQSRRSNTAKRRLLEAKFPDTKTLDQIDYAHMQGVPKATIQKLACGQFISDAEDVVIVGPVGTGKTHLAIGLAVEAARRRTRVLFTRAAELVRQLVEAKNERQLGRLHRSFQNIPLLIVDELGFVPFDKVEGELLFNLLAERYERRSTIVTSNLAFSEWAQIFGSEKMTTALLDRLAHHAHVLTTKGKSFRTQNKRKES